MTEEIPLGLWTQILQENLKKGLGNLILESDAGWPPGSYPPAVTQHQVLECGKCGSSSELQISNKPLLLLQTDGAGGSLRKGFSDIIPYVLIIGDSRMLKEF